MNDNVYLVLFGQIQLTELKKIIYFTITQLYRPWKLLKNLTQFQTNKLNAIFPTLFQSRPQKSIPVIAKKFFKWIRIFLFLTYSFGIETIKTFIQSRSSLKNHTQFQTKMGKVYKSFSLSRNKNLNWKPSSGRSQENEML